MTSSWIVLPDYYDAAESLFCFAELIALSLININAI